jgi:hypothetical protein
MKGELAADKIKAASGKRHRRAIRLDPGDTRHLQARLSQHAEWAVEANIRGTRHQAAVGDQLISSSAADIQNGRISRFAFPGKGQKLGIGRARPIGLGVVKMRDLIVIYLWLSPHRASAAPRDRPRLEAAWASRARDISRLFEFFVRLIQAWRSNTPKIAIVAAALMPIAHITTVSLPSTAASRLSIEDSLFS